MKMRSVNTSRNFKLSWNGGTNHGAGVWVKEYFSLWNTIEPRFCISIDGSYHIDPYIQFKVLIIPADVGSEP